MNPSTNIFRDFKWNIIARFVILLLLAFSLSFILLETNLWTLIFWLAIIILFVSIEFIRYVEKFKEQFLYFISSINQEDFSIHFPDNRNFREKEFTTILNELIEKFKNLRVERETRHQYLKAIVEGINIGIVGYNQDGRITLINEGAKKIFQKPYLKNINALKNINIQLFNEIDQLRANKKSLVKFVRNNNLYHLSLQANEIKLGDELVRVISMQDIKSELDEKEVESWQRLVRVINHEIMNSVIPISTLANVLNQMLEENIKKMRNGSHQGSSLDDAINDILDGIQTIEYRSHGLVNFVKATKSLTSISKPGFRDVPVNNLFHRLDKLLRPEMEKENIHFFISKCDDTLSVKADFELIEQVLINIVKNAKEAFAGSRKTRKEIKLMAKLVGPEVRIIVSDNGPGIPEKELDNIFIPFYTTKESGSGIGLSLSRHIMRLHKGSIDVKTQPGTGTSFILIF